MRVHVGPDPLDVAEAAQAVASHRNGATVVFVGTVREVNEGRAVTGIDYRAYEAMAVRELEAIVAEAAARYDTGDLVVRHRVGTLGLGDASVVVAAAHPRRAGAFDAARWVLEELKRRVPIWKREHYADGAREWVDQQGGQWGAAS